MKFGNWENKEAFEVIEKEIENGIIHVHTLDNIFSIFKEKKTFLIVDEQDSEKKIYSEYQLKRFFDNKLITKIIVNKIVKFVLPDYNLKKHLPKLLPHVLNIRELNSKQKNLYKRYHKDDMKRYVIPKLNETYSFEPYRYPDSEDYSICNICYDPLKCQKVGVADKCGHMFHKECAGKHIDYRGSCPTCRAPVKTFKRVASQSVPQFGIQHVPFNQQHFNEFWKEVVNYKKFDKYLGDYVSINNEIYRINKIIHDTQNEEYYIRGPTFVLWSKRYIKFFRSTNPKRDFNFG